MSRSSVDLSDVLLGGGLVGVAVAVAVLLGWPCVVGLLGLVAVVAGILLGMRGAGRAR